MANKVDSPLLYKVILCTTKFTGAGLLGGLLKVVLYLNSSAFVIGGVLVGTGIVIASQHIKGQGKVDTSSLVSGLLLGLFI